MRHTGAGMNMETVSVAPHVGALVVHIVHCHFGGDGVRMAVHLDFWKAAAHERQDDQADSCWHQEAAVSQSGEHSERLAFIGLHHDSVPAPAPLIRVSASAADRQCVLCGRSRHRTLLGKSYGGVVDLLAAFTKPFLPDDGSGDAILAVMVQGASGAIIHLCQVRLATDGEQPIEELIEQRIAGTERIPGGMGRELGVPGWVDRPRGAA